MSADPQQMQQLLQMYQMMYPQQSPQQQGLGMIQQQVGTGAPAGTNSRAGAANGLTQLALAMMRAKQKPPQVKPPIPTGTQGQTLTAPVDNSSAPAGMMGPP